MVQPYRVIVFFRGVSYSILNPKYIYTQRVSSLYNRSLNRVIPPLR